MKKILLILLIPFLYFSCEDDPEPRSISFKIDGVAYRSLIPGALLTANQNGTFDIQINTVESNYTFNLFIDDKPLQNIYGEAIFVFIDDSNTYDSRECTNQINMTVTFNELNINTTRLNGTFSGRVCDAGFEKQLTDGIIDNIRLL